MIDLICVDPQKVDQVWPHVKSLVKRAVDRGYSDFDQIERDVQNANALLWVAWDGFEILGAGITQITPNKDCTIIAWGGRQMWKWIHLEQKVADYAKAEGCRRLLIIGRKGWQRMLPHYKPLCVTLERPL